MTVFICIYRLTNSIKYETYSKRPLAILYYGLTTATDSYFQWVLLGRMSRFCGLYLFVTHWLGRRTYIRLLEYILYMIIWNKKWTEHFEDVWQQSNVHYMNIDFEIWKRKQIRKASIFSDKKKYKHAEMQRCIWWVFMTFIFNQTWNILVIFCIICFVVARKLLNVGIEAI